MLPSARFQGVRFAPSVLRTFLKENGISAVVRAHQTADRGVELFAGGLGVTVFSAADYPEDRDAESRAGNWAAVVQVGRDGVMYPRLLPPGPRPRESEEEARRSGAGGAVMGGRGGEEDDAGPKEEWD